ncbi:MAG: Ig-like domain-containing protein [Alistipes sp.]|jgi:hypothetical protein|nr:Ig-like domain-containing protein [Alistipes sp.]
MKKYLAFAAAVAVLVFTGCKDDPETGDISVASVQATPVEVEVEIGNTYTVQPSVLPANATNKAVSFSTSDSTIATVDAATGVVTAIALGEAVITVTTADGGYTDTSTVTVVTPKPEIASDLDFEDVNEFTYSEIRYAIEEREEGEDEEEEDPVEAFVTVSTEDTVGSLKLTLTSENATVAAAMTQMGLTGAIDLVAPSAAQVTALNLAGIPHGAAVTGKDEVEIDFIEMFGLLVEAIPGNVDLAIAFDVADVNEFKADPVTLSVLLVDDSMVTIAGDGFDIAETMEIVESESADAPVVIDVYAGQGIENFFITIDTASVAFNGTLAFAGITGEFDLANPGDELGAKLTAIGLPNGDAIKGMSAVPFDITEFIAMIFAATEEEGDIAAEFTIKVVDTTEKSAEATLAINFVDDAEPGAETETPETPEEEAE